MAGRFRRNRKEAFGAGSAEPRKATRARRGAALHPLLFVRRFAFLNLLPPQPHVVEAIKRERRSGKPSRPARPIS